MKNHLYTVQYFGKNNSLIPGSVRQLQRLRKASETKFWRRSAFSVCNKTILFSAFCIAVPHLNRTIIEPQRDGLHFMVHVPTRENRCFHSASGRHAEAKSGQAGREGTEPVSIPVCHVMSIRRCGAGSVAIGGGKNLL